MTLKFSGAYNPAYIIRQKKLIESKGDVIYLFSDGCADQFSRKSGKKFMTKNFKELLITISQYSMHKRKEILDETI